ncbi:MAG TPA: PAS domain S-box protein [Streptosporangiaceae bacterium]|nr:PAS domain S-box protein [Streptosporangiaceae bacterium]
MRVSGAKQATKRVPRQPPAAAGLPSARVRVALLEYAVEHLLSPRPARDALSRLVERLAAAFGAQAALVIAPGAALPLGEGIAYPPDLSSDLVLLAQIRSAWATLDAQAAVGQPSAGGHASAVGRAFVGGRAFELDLDSGPRRVGLLIVAAEPADGQSSCALALVGDSSRWKAGARSTLKAVATVIAALFSRDPEAVLPDPRPARAPRAPRGPRAPREVVGPDLEPSGPVGRDSLARALVAGCPAAVVAVDSDRRIREFNPAAEELFGYARAEVIGLNMPEKLMPEQFRPLFVDAMAGYLATGDQRGFIRHARLRALRSDGTDRPIELTPMPVTVAGETYFFGFMRDVTELENATHVTELENATVAVVEGDARFRLLSDLAPVGIVQTDVKGVCRFVNDKWCELAGIGPAQVIGTNWRDTINPDDVERIDAMRDMSGTTTELATDCRLRTASGREVWVHAVVRRVVDQHGKLVGRVAALTDVHHRKRAEAAQEQDRRRLAEQNVELRDLNDTRLRYLATVSHELRTPLTSIVSFAELLRSECPQLGQEAGEYLDVIQRNAERLLRVVGDLLDLSSLEEGVARLDLAPTSVPWVTRESVRTGWSIAAVDGISLDISVQEGPIVRADASRLQQVLDNLISNAVKFSPAGGRVQVRATHDAREWRIDVADTGMGIPPSEMDHLFDRFFRASNARRAEVPGTGLGLPTAKAITELLGGRIEVASTVGKGTTFTVYLPIER